jgi:hypothetical protein
MSYFLYNQNGQQAIARLYLDGEAAVEAPGPSPMQTPSNMPHYHTQNNWDTGTNAPSQNFIYDFDFYRFCVSDTWQEVLAHDENGEVQTGSVTALADAFAGGCEVKVGVRNLCAELSDADNAAAHELFVQVGSCYYYTERQLFIAGSHPLIRVRPAIPMQYATQGWDCGWLVLRTDGIVAYRRCDPYTLQFSDTESRYAIRWFVR